MKNPVKKDDRDYRLVFHVIWFSLEDVILIGSGQF